MPLLTVLSQTNVKGGELGTGKCELGKLNPISSTRALCQFTLKNETNRSVPILKLRGSCGCQTLKMSKRGVEVVQTALVPDEKLDIEIAINLSGLRGSIRKFAWVYGASNEPLATMEMAGTINEVVSFDPAVLDFGKGAGGARSLALTVVADAEAVKNGIFPPLKSDKLSEPPIVQFSLYWLSVGKRFCGKKSRWYCEVSASDGRRSHERQRLCASSQSARQQSGATPGTGRTHQPRTRLVRLQHERVHDDQIVEAHAVLKVLGIQRGAARVERALHDQRVPGRELA